MGATNSKPPPVSHVAYKGNVKKAGGGGVDPPASWNTTSRNFQQISPKSDISAPSKIAYSHHHQHRRHPEMRRRLSQQIAPPAIHEDLHQSRDDSMGAGANRRNARYRGHPHSDNHSSSKRRSRSAPPPSRQQRFKEKREHIKEVFMGCLEDSAQKFETVKDEALVPAARKVKTGLNATGKATKHYTKAAVKNVRKQHIMKKVKNLPSKVAGSCLAERRNNDAYYGDHLEKVNHSTYHDDERMLRYASLPKGIRQDSTLEMSEEHLRNMKRCIDLMEARHGAKELKTDTIAETESRDPQEIKMELSSSNHTETRSSETVPTPMLKLGDQFSAELAFHHEDSYFRRLAAEKDSPAEYLKHQDTAPSSLYYISSPDSVGSPVVSLFSSKDRAEKAVKSQTTIGKNDRQAVSESTNHPEPTQKLTNAKSQHSSKQSERKRDQNIHRLRQDETEQCKGKSREKPQHLVSKKALYKNDSATTLDQDHATSKKKSKSRKPNVKVTTKPGYQVDTTWLKLTPDGVPIILSSKAVAVTKLHPKSGTSLDTNESVLDIVRNDTAPSMVETYAPANHDLTIRKTESAPSMIENQKQEKATAKQIRNGHKNKTHSSSQKLEDYDTVAAPSHSGREEKRRPSSTSKAHTQTRIKKTSPKEASVDATVREELLVPPPGASLKSTAIASFSPTQDSLLDGSVSCPPFSDQALSNAAFLFSPSYAHGAIGIPHRSSPTREASFAISTFESRNRLTTLSSRSRPNFSIPAKISQNSHVSLLTKTSSSHESESQRGGILRRSSSGSKKQVRFSDVSETSKKQATDRPEDVVLPAVESKLSDLSDDTLAGRSSSASDNKDTLRDIGNSSVGRKSSSSAKSTVSGWSYREAADGKLSSVTPVNGKHTGRKKPTSSPMRRFYAAKNKFANPQTMQAPSRKTPPKRFTRRSPKHGIVSSRITEFNGRLKSTRQPVLKNTRRETGGHGVIAPRQATLVNPLFSRAIHEHENVPQEAKIEFINSVPSDEETLSGEYIDESQGLDIEEHHYDVLSMPATESSITSPTSHSVSMASTEEESDIFTNLRTSNGTQEKVVYQDEEESILSERDEDAKDVFAQIMSKPSIDISEAPSVATLRSRFSVDDSRAPSVATLVKGDFPSRASTGRPPRKQEQPKMHTEDPSIVDSVNAKDKENESVSTYSLSISHAPSFGSRAPVNPREQWQHHRHATPENLCLSPLQRTPMQARKWRTLAAEVKERDRAKNASRSNSKKLQKNRKAFKERSLNVF